jgi:hypothetical protein
MQIINEVIESFNEYIQQIENGGERIAEILRQEQYDSALELINQLAEGLIWMADVASKLTEQGISVELSIESITEFLTEINEGLEIKDFVLVADIFEYELDPFIKKLQPIKYIKVGN